MSTSPPPASPPPRSNTGPLLPIRRDATSGAPPRTARGQQLPKLPKFTRFDMPDDDGDDDVRTEPTTPTFSQQVGELRRTLSMASFDNLRLLAQERDRREVLQREVLSKVWRPKNEKGRKPQDWERLLVHATRGGTRAFLLSYTIRAGINFVLAVLAMSRRKKLHLASLRHAIFGPDTWRFGLQFGIFAWLWKFTHHALRMLDPSSEGGHKRWHSALAGAVSSAGALVERRDRRLALGQQLTIRGLQGLYRSGKARNWIHIPHGEVLLFGLACGQIMYAWIMRPDTIPKAYSNWILDASKVYPPAVPMHRSLLRTGKFDAASLQRIVDRGVATPAHRRELERRIAGAMKGDFGMPFAPTAVTHPWIDGILPAAIERFYVVSKWMLPVYAALHFVPAFILRRRAFTKDPALAIFKSIVGTFRSSAFLGVFVIIFQSLFSLKHAVYERYSTRIPLWLARFLISKQSLWILGFSTCASLFVEEKKRRAELALYVLPKAMESAWNIGRQRRWLPHVPAGDQLLVTLGLASVMQTYAHEPEMLSGLVRTLLYQFVGRG